jgi:hypothetical protein
MSRPRPVTRRLSAVLMATLALAPARALRADEAADPARPGATDTADMTDLRNDAITAYNAQNYSRAAALAGRWLERAEADGRSGREVAAISFILGHSRYELHQKEQTRYTGDYRADVVAPIDESLRILQDDPAFKNMLLGNAWHTLWSESGRTDPEAEERGH